MWWPLTGSDPSANDPGGSVCADDHSGAVAAARGVEQDPVALPFESLNRRVFVNADALIASRRRQPCVEFLSPCHGDDRSTIDSYRPVPVLQPQFFDRDEGDIKGQSEQAELVQAEACNRPAAQLVTRVRLFLQDDKPIGLGGVQADQMHRRGQACRPSPYDGDF